MGMQNITIRFPVSEKSKLTEAAECREARKKGTGRTPSPLARLAWSSSNRNC